MSTWDPAKVRLRVHRNLSAIVDMYAELPAHAQAEGDPTGEAVLLLGHVANGEAFGYRLDAAKDSTHAADQVERDVLFVLASWEDLVREERDQPTDLRATVQRAADYLRDSIDWAISEDENGDIRFLGIDALDNDLSSIRAMLETVLHDGIRSDRGVPCLQCSQLLVKSWASTPEGDRWICENRDCGVTTVQGDELALAVKATVRAYAEWLSATDMYDQYRIPAGTVRRWASGDEPTVRKKRDQNTGRIVYNVADATAQRDTPTESLDNDNRSREHRSTATHP